MSANPIPRDKRRPPSRRAVWTVRIVVYSVIALATWFYMTRYYGTSRHFEQDKERHEFDLSVARADYLSAPSGRAAAFDEVIRRYSDHPDQRIREGVEKARQRKLSPPRRRTGQPGAAVRDGNSKSARFARCRALLVKARIAGANEEKAGYCDAILKQFGDDADESLQILVLRTYMLKAETIADDDERTDFFREMLEHFDEIDSDAVETEVAKTLNSLAKGEDDSDVKAGFYNSLLDRYAESEHRPLQHQVALAMLELARITGDREKKMRLYEEVTERYGKSDDDYLQQCVEYVRRHGGISNDG